MFACVDVGSEERRRRRRSRLSLKKKARGPNEDETSGAFYEPTHATNDEPAKPNPIDVLEDTDDQDSVDLLRTVQEPEMEMTKLGMSGRLRERITRSSSRRNSPYLEDEFALEIEKPKRSSRRKKSDIPDSEGRVSRKRKRKSEGRPHRRQADTDDEDDDGFERKKSRRKKRKKTSLQRDETVGRRTTRGKSTVSYRYAEEGMLGMHLLRIYDIRFAHFSKAILFVE